MKTSSKSYSTIFLLIILGAVTIVVLFPLYWALNTSFLPNSAISQKSPTPFPFSPTFTHYKELFDKIHFGRVFFNSVFVSLAVTVTSLFFNALGGYTFAKFEFTGKKTLLILLLLTMMVPAQVTLIPLFLLLRNLGLLNSYFALILPVMVTAFGLFLMRQYILSIPDAYLEAARLDGCGEWRLFGSVILPLCRPMLAALGVFTFTAAWSDFMLPIVVLHDDRMYTLPVALASLSGQNAMDWGLLMAGAVAATAPIVIVFLYFQRAFVEGASNSGLK